MEDEKEICSRCGEELELVCPGKHQCNHCDTIDFLERRLHKALELSGELIAMIRLNVMRDSFRDVTIEEADEHLKPWIKRLNDIALKPDFGPTNVPALATRGLEPAPENHAGDGQPSGLPAAHGSASSE